MSYFTSQKVKKWNTVVFGILITTLMISCKYEKNINAEINGDKEKGIDKKLLEVNNDTVDILRYKVKREILRKDSLQLIFKNSYLYPLSENEYKLQINVDHDHKALNYYTDYYIIMAIYPKDDEIHLLDTARQRYKFESFSVKIKKDSNNELIISRKIKTKINFARAVTISLMAFKTKQKSIELVLMDVNFLN